jgi:hypothetical protein
MPLKADFDESKIVRRMCCHPKKVQETMLKRDLKNFHKNKGPCDYESESSDDDMHDKDMGIVEYSSGISKKYSAFNCMRSHLDNLYAADSIEREVTVTLTRKDMHQMYRNHRYYYKHRPDASLVEEMKQFIDEQVEKGKQRIFKRATKESIDFLMLLRGLLEYEVLPYSEGERLIRRVANQQTETNIVKNSVFWFENTKGVGWSIREH